MKYSTRQTYFHGQGHLTKKFPTERVAEYEHRLLQSIERVEDLDTRVQAVGSDDPELRFAVANGRRES